MDFKTIEELSVLMEKSRRTLDRKIKTLAKTQPEKYLSLIKPGKRILYSIEIISFIGDLPDSVIETVKTEIATKAKNKASRPPTPAQVINIDPDSSDKTLQMALFNDICNRLQTGDNSLSEIVTSCNITIEKFLSWVNSNASMKAAYTTALEIHKLNAHDAIYDLALRQIKKGITGYTIDLESTSYQQRIGPNGEVVMIPQDHRVTKKHVLPRSDLIMFALTNRDPKDWKRSFPLAKPEDDQEPDYFDKMSDADLMAYIEKAKTMGLLQSDNSKQQEIL